MKTLKPTVPEVIERFRTYHALNPVWGSLHVVLDDPNYKDDHVRGCLRYAEERGDTEGVELAKILLQMSQTQRRKIAREA